MVKLTTLKWGNIILILLTITMCSAGCLSWHSADGTRHTLILGIGLVSTKEAPDGSATALRANTLGLAVRPPHGGVVLGYQSLHVTSIPPEWEGLIQVNAAPGQPLIVEGHASGREPFSAANTLAQKEKCP